MNTKIIALLALLFALPLFASDTGHTACYQSGNYVQCYPANGIKMDNNKSILFYELSANGSNHVDLKASSSMASDFSLLLPAANDTLVGKATTDTLTNKTIDGASNTITNAFTIGAFGSATANGATLVGGSTFELTPADATHGGIITTGSQSLAGQKTVNDNFTLGTNLIYTITTDATLTGSNAELLHPTTFVRLTNGSLVSISCVDTTSVSSGHTMIVVNATGNAITLKNNGTLSGTSAVILTASGADEIVSDKGAFQLIYSSGASAWYASALNSSTLSNKTLNNTNTVTLKDTNFTLQDDGSASKQAVFELSGLSAATRTFTLPDASTTIVGTDTTQTTSNKTEGIANGTAAAPSLNFTSDADGSGTGIYRIGANNLGFSANGTAVGNISSAGAFTLGPASGLTATHTIQAGQQLIATFSETAAATQAEVAINSTSGDSILRYNNSFSIRSGTATSISIDTSGNTDISNATTMSRNTGGGGSVLGMTNTATTPGGSDLGISINFSNGNTTTTGQFIRFSRGGSTQGYVGQSAGNTAYNTTSDKRLKEKITKLDHALEMVRKMNPVKFFWKEGGHESRGVIAQEMAQVYPYAVSGDPNGDVKTEPMAVDYSKLTVPAIAAIKELDAQVQELRSMVAELKKDGCVVTPDGQVWKRRKQLDFGKVPNDGSDDSYNYDDIAPVELHQ